MGENGTLFLAWIWRVAGSTRQENTGATRPTSGIRPTKENGPQTWTRCFVGRLLWQSSPCWRVPKPTTSPLLALLSLSCPSSSFPQNRVSVLLHKLLLLQLIKLQKHTKPKIKTEDWKSVDNFRVLHMGSYLKSSEVIIREILVTVESSIGVLHGID